jgi:hypothetical protein
MLGEGLQNILGVNGMVWLQLQSTGCFGSQLELLMEQATQFLTISFLF